MRVSNSVSRTRTAAKKKLLRGASYWKIREKNLRKKMGLLRKELHGKTFALESEKRETQRLLDGIVTAEKQMGALLHYGPLGWEVTYLNNIESFSMDRTMTPMYSYGVVSPVYLVPGIASFSMEVRGTGKVALTQDDYERLVKYRGKES